MRRLSTAVASAARTQSSTGDTWLSAMLTFEGLKKLGLPQTSLDSFSWEFKQGMANRASALGDTGESSPDNWEKPLGTPDVHVLLVALAPDSKRLEWALEGARKALKELSGVVVIWRQDCYAPPHLRSLLDFATEDVTLLSKEAVFLEVIRKRSP